MNPLHGIINFNKPVGITSAKALYRVRSITGQKKSGHAGTLDPGASGVLVLCLGKATKLVESIMDQPKVYRAVARLDLTSDSYDSDGVVRTIEPSNIPNRDTIIQTCRSFEGETQQVPPEISAVKIDGQPAYKRARRNQPVRLKPRPVHIYWIHIHRYDRPELDFELACGRGTYIRSFIRDLGECLGTGGCLTTLLRTRVGPFVVENAWTLDTLQSSNDSTNYLIDLDHARTLLTVDSIEIPVRPQSNKPS